MHAKCRHSDSQAQEKTKKVFFVSYPYQPSKLHPAAYTWLVSHIRQNESKIAEMAYPIHCMVLERTKQTRAENPVSKNTSCFVELSSLLALK